MTTRIPDGTRVFEVGGGNGITAKKTPWTARRGYPQVDEIITHAPVEVTPGIFDDFPLTRISTRHLYNALSRASSVIVGLEASCQQLLKDARARRVVTCLSNLTERRTVDSLEKELLRYERCLESSAAKDTTLLIKGHPRETQSQSEVGAPAATSSLQYRLPRWIYCPCPPVADRVGASNACGSSFHQ